MSDYQYAVELNNLTKRYGDFTAVKEVSLQVPRGAIYGFLGPNGAGKTTTLRMILDIVKPTSGSLTVLGAPSAMDVRERIGYLPEEKGLYKKMKTWAVIAYFARLKGVGGKEAKQRAYELLERYGLKDFSDKKVETLSKGMGQKVQVLASIAHQPEFVILDEPFSGLDPSNQQVMEDVISDLNKAGSTIVFSTHVMSHAERICDRLLLIAKAEKIFDGTIPEAKAIIPKMVNLSGVDDPNKLRALPGVTSAESTDGLPGSYDVCMADDADPQQLLRDCFRDDIELTSFNYREPTLHDVFLHLVGEDAKVASFR
ncbi:MAG: ATP-binding cassette domain-containing protein [Planctomycetes bacterium]|nr:ATP-binding cassette domain-containing protein [Planctomycetota bacterium]MCP4770969.1 ATP-binding cassette domain-containing protein [Planctomycetota bacterium]MCP4861688.1 ATP-binding cassette domain-containing protein [Planctomycetota bacterium]